MDIRTTIFEGHEGLELLTEHYRMVLVTDCGPRIAFLGRREGGNLLFWKEDALTRGDWKLYGGHRVWITRPYADESEDTYLPDNAPCQVQTGAYAVTAVSPAHPCSKLARGIRVEIIGDGQFRVTNLIRNEGSLISSGGVWSPTCIEPGERVLRIPLGEEGSTWDIVKLMIPLRFAGNTARLDDPQVTLTEGELVVVPDGGLCKRCACAPKGQVIMDCPREGLRFTKEARYRREARYPLDGCNVAVFVGADNWMGELETYGPEQALRPGETMEHAELWTLTALEKQA